MKAYIPYTEIIKNKELKQYMEQEKKMADKPKKTYKSGMIGLAAWENTSKVGNTFPGFTLQKTYYESDDTERKNPKNTNNLSVTDLPDAIAVLQKALSDHILVFE